MMRQLLCCLLLLPVSWVNGQPAQWSPLLDVDTLAELLAAEQDVRVMQVTGSAQGGLIPGAQWVPYAAFRGPANNAGQLPAPAELQALVQRAGLTADTPVVLVHQGVSAADFGAATRVYWTLKSLGVRHLAVLNGGFVQWQAAGLPVSYESRAVVTSEFIPVWQNTWRLSTAEVEQAILDPAVTLLDSRPLSFYLGQQAVAARPGTIRGADNLSYETWFAGNLLKPQAELQQLLAANRPEWSATTVTFCNTGHWASINWFVLSEILGVSDTRLYAESVVEWAQLPRPMDNQPGRLTVYWAMTTSWLRQLTGR
jgi:thiosulfate/3-mercaptopyruvate sulfurtransferase